MMPFPGGIEGVSNATLLIALAAAALSAFLIETRQTLMRSAIRILPAALLAVLTGLEDGPLLLAVGFAFVAIGDGFLSRDGGGSFASGTFLRAAGHIAYAALFLTAGGGMRLLIDDQWRVIAEGIFAATLLIGVLVVVRQSTPASRLPTLADASSLLAMGLAALTTDNPWIIAVVLAVTASDALLIRERQFTAAISSSRGGMRLAAWTIQMAAQLLLAAIFIPSFYRG